MRELEKMNKVIGSLIEGAPHETLLVVDSTTGQNGIPNCDQMTSAPLLFGVGSMDDQYIHDAFARAILK